MVFGVRHNWPEDLGKHRITSSDKGNALRLKVGVTADRLSLIARLVRGLGGRGGCKSGEESPGSTELRCRVTPGGVAALGPRLQGKCHRKHTAGFRAGKVETVRQERTARLATEAARQTPPGARPNRGGT